jgi:hypothetical protein
LSKTFAPIITPNAKAGTINFSAVFTKVEVLNTFTPPFHLPIIKLPQYRAMKGDIASSKIFPNSAVLIRQVNY